MPLAVLLLPVAVAWVALALWRPLPETRSPSVATLPVVDERGRTVVLPQPLGTQAVFMAIGVGEYLVTTRRPGEVLTSASAENTRIKHSSLLARAFPDLPLMRTTLSSAETGTVNIERLLRDRPGVVVTWWRLAAGFERVGLATVGLGPASSEARIVQNARLFAAMTGQAPRTEAMIARSASERAGIASAVGRTVAYTTRVLFLFRSGPGRWRAAFAFPGLMADAGGENIGTGLAFADVDAERLLALSPDVIVVSGDATSAGSAVEAVLVDPMLAAVPAVVHQRVYYLPSGLTGFMNDVIDRPIYLAWLADVLHPEMATLMARGVARRVYTTELGVTPTDAELDWALASVIGSNAASSAEHARR